jgi:hypothetical protein
MGISEMLVCFRTAASREIHDAGISQKYQTVDTGLAMGFLPSAKILRSKLF